MKQMSTVIPYFDKVETGVDSMYQFSMKTVRKGLQEYHHQIKNGRKRYNKITNETRIKINQMTRYTVKEVLLFVEHMLGITSPKSRKIGERVDRIYETIMKQYVVRYGNLTAQKLRDIGQAVRSQIFPYFLPMYINMKAVSIISLQMLQKFIEGSLKNMKAIFQFTKASVFIILQGKFSIENTKIHFLEAISKTKKFTIKMVHKGMQIRINRKVIMNNYDTFIVQFLQFMQQILEYINYQWIQVKKNSRALYNKVLKQISEKKIEIKEDYKYCLDVNKRQYKEIGNPDMYPASD